MWLLALAHSLQFLIFAKKDIFFDMNAMKIVRAIIIIPLMEEATFRYLLPALIPIMNNQYINALIFSIYHIDEYFLSPMGLLKHLFVFVIGLLTFRMRNIKYAIYLHSWFNLFGCVIYYQLRNKLK